MRIARFTTGSNPMFGIVQEKDGVDMVYGITGDPLYTQIQPNGTILPLEDVRLLAPVIPRSKVVGVGKNYAEHAREMGGEAPETPLLFLKPNTSVIGPNDPVIYPSYAKELSFEAELAIVIKSLAKIVPAERAADVILGYTCANDLTVRDAQREESQWFRAKAFDTSCPLGPWIETDLDTAQTRIRSRVNGEVKQDATSAQMLRTIPELIEEITRSTTLLPGDVILTGTPAGVGLLEAGATVEIDIDGLGTLTNRVVTPEELEA